MIFEEHPDRFVVRHQARIRFFKLMGYVSMCGILPFSVLLFFTRLYAPEHIALECTRAQAQCTLGPVQAGWGTRQFPLGQLALAHVEKSGGNRILYVGTDGGRPRFQLSNEADSTATGDAYVAAAARMQAFVHSGEPTLSLSWPAGDKGMGYLQNFFGFVFALFWTVVFFRVPRALELVFDRATKQLRITRRFVGRVDVQEHSLIEVARVAPIGGTFASPSPRARLERAAVALVLHDGSSIVLFDEGAFPASRADAAELAQKLGTWLGVPVAGS